MVGSVWLHSTVKKISVCLLPLKKKKILTVFIDEVVLDELDGQGGFTDTTTTNNNKLVFCSHSLRKEQGLATLLKSFFHFVD